MRLEWLNCLWLMIPLLAWNIILGPRLSQEAIASDAHSPVWLLWGENIGRVLVFAAPLLIPMRLADPLSQAGLGVCIAGTLVYFGSWLPLIRSPASSWSRSAAGLLAPRLTPWLPFLGIALIGGAWWYALIATAFVAVHTAHGVQNLSGPAL